MFEKFRYERLLLEDILLDDRNPRIVTQSKLDSQQKILKYLFDHEQLSDFIKKIVSEGKNPGAERPYVVKAKSQYIVIEGNTRIAAYKVLTGLLTPPAGYADIVPQISKSLRSAFLQVDCSIAPSRDALLPIVANAHFGLGDKSKWGYLGSRKAVFDEWKAGKTIAQLAKAFDRTKGQINDLILEYELYLTAIRLKWTKDELNVLLDPAVEFNPPVRFLQGRGHKAKIGITFDKANHKVIFDEPEASAKFKHLVKKLVVNPEHGLGATADYDSVFKDFGPLAPANKNGGKTADKQSNKHGPTSREPNGSTQNKPKPYALFSYAVTVSSGVIIQLMREATLLNCKVFPAAGTFLLRNIVESIAKQIIHDQKANPASKPLDLEASINICLSNSVSLPREDKKVLKEFQKSHVTYLNLGAHGNVIPNVDRLISARDCIDQFVKRNV